MRLKNITLAGVILLVLAFTIGMAGAIENGTANETAVNQTTINETAVNQTTVNETAGEADDEYNGIFGPGHLLYRLQIAFDNMGEVFTYNASERLGKQVSNARHRINEYRAALKRNDNAAAEIALGEYEVKMNQVADSVSKLSDNDTGLINAQKEIAKHQVILEMLLVSHPNSTGLQRAYNNSIRHEEKFKLNIQRKSEQIENMGTVIEIKEERKEAVEAIKNNRTETTAGHNETATIKGNQRQSRRS